MITTSRKVFGLQDASPETVEIPADAKVVAFTQDLDDPVVIFQHDPEVTAVREFEVMLVAYDTKADVSGWHFFAMISTYEGQQKWYIYVREDQIEPPSFVQPEPDVDNSPEPCSDLLSLASVSVPADVCASWTEEQRNQAMNWAAAVHLAASDNDDVAIPDKPDFLPDETSGPIDPDPAKR